MSQAWVRPARAPGGLARRAQLRTASLYLVTDDETPAAQLPHLISRAVAGGVEIVQLRRKQVAAEELRAVALACLEAAHEGGALFLVDDHVDLAVAIGADGDQLGQTDLDPGEARHQPVDYLSAGPVHATPTKPGRAAVGFEHVTVAAVRASVPVVAIGGLGLGSVGTAIAAGADIAGVVRAICLADDPARVSAELRAEIGATAPWIRFRVNGQERKCPPGSSIRAFLELLEVALDGVVVERNGEILRAAELAGVALRDGDDLEVVHLVGGGIDHG